MDFYDEPFEVYPNSSISSSASSSRIRLTNVQKESILAELVRLSIDGRVLNGTLVQVANSFNVSVRTIQRIWKQARTSFEATGVLDVTRKYVNKVGRKKKSIDFSSIVSIPLRHRTNIRSLAIHINVFKSVLHRRIKQDGIIKPHTNALKPHLTDANKRVRLQFCLSMLEPLSLRTSPVFRNMFNVIHVDEKWFFMTKESERYYLHSEEEQLVRTCKSKKFITKVMFLATVAQPRFDCSKNQDFDGKIGIFPFVFKEPAKRNSKNRFIGTLETKPVLSVTKDVYRRCLIENLLLSIRSKWPKGCGMNEIFIQQDNAKPHIDPSDADFIEAANGDDFRIHLSFQPPNSPDMNVLDLGYFRAIQSLQHQKAPKIIDELVLAVEESFEQLSSESLNNVFLTLQTCMIEVMKDLGGNNYKLPHMGKKRLIKDGSLPLQISCEKELINQVAHYL